MISYIVTSVLGYDKAPLSYNPKRSVFSVSERISQTKKTIISIRKTDKHANIILIEAGNLNLRENALARMANQYIYIGKNKWVRKFVDGPLKGRGEVVILLFGIIYANGLFRSEKIVKLSGRYEMLDKFNKQLLNNDYKIVAKKYTDTISTRLYSIDKSEALNWIVTLIVAFFLQSERQSVEHVLYKLLKKKIHFVDTLGIKGRIAVDGKYIEE